MPAPPPLPRIPAGVVFNAPPLHLLADAARELKLLAAQLPPGTTGAVVGLITDAGVNAAVIHRLGDRFAVGAWVGKDWGTRITGGGLVQATW